MPKEAVTPGEARAEGGSWQHLWEVRGERSPSGAGLLAGLVTHNRAVHEELQPEGRMHVEVHGGLSPVGGTPRWHGKSVRSLLPEDKGAAEANV